VIYEMHVGTFTPQGTWAAALDELPELARAGMTVVEVMPVADFVGRFGWGYDGVCHFAPTRLYGAPDDFRRFVDRAHACGIGVILDVVYNHYGPVGNMLGCFSDRYVSERYPNEWGASPNFDGPGAAPVREFVLANVRHWIDEYHLDGLRFDATQSIHDASGEHILTQLVETARTCAAERSLLIVAENEPQDVRLLRSRVAGGHGMDAAWNDDFHHSAMVRLTGHNEAYYSDYRGTVEELLAAVKFGFLYQGQRSQWQKQPRGTPALGQPGAAFITFLQNHDQIANSGFGLRIDRLTSPARLRAMTALWLLAPQTPMFFQGQEFAASAPFLYFADNRGAQSERVAAGRREFLSQFPTLATPEVRTRLAPPHAIETFERCRLDLAERQKHAPIYQLHIDLLRLRREDPVFRRQRADRLDGAALDRDCLLLRYFGDDGDDRLVFVNFGNDLTLSPAPQPLLAPPAHLGWELLWSSSRIEYGGGGTPPLETEAGWFIPGECAVVLRSAQPLPDRATRAQNGNA
jgi:maltooligosyltrehalose trehalohydrolase